MKRMFLMLICCGALGFAQEPAAGTEKTVQLGTAATEKPKYLQSVIEVKNGEVNDLARLLDTLAPGGTRVSTHHDLKLISIGTYDPEFIKLADEIVKRYDVARQKEPPAVQHDIELTAYILVASPQGTAGDALPADLDGVAKQLRAVFGYRDLKLVDTALIRAREGRPGNMSGELYGLAEDVKAPADYQMDFTSAQVRAGERGNVVALGDFRFSLPLVHHTYGVNGVTVASNIGFKTDLSIADSQKVVVGKSRIGGADQALVLVLTARVVN